MEAIIKYINIISAENISEVIIMRKMKMRTPGMLMLGIGITAAAAAMTPAVRNMMMNKSNKMSFGNSDNYNNLH